MFQLGGGGGGGGGGVQRSSRHNSKSAQRIKKNTAGSFDSENIQFVGFQSSSIPNGACFQLGVIHSSCSPLYPA